VYHSYSKLVHSGIQILKKPNVKAETNALRTRYNVYHSYSKLVHSGIQILKKPNVKAETNEALFRTCRKLATLHEKTLALCVRQLGLCMK